MTTGNKGEWSEVYVLLRLLGDKKLQPGDANLQKIPGLYYPVISITRNSTGENQLYRLDGDEVVIEENGTERRIPSMRFTENSYYLLAEIKKKKKGTFTIPKTEGFMQDIRCLSLKAGSSEKSDISVSIYDQRTGQKPVLGFSIKSQLGSPSTLLNAGRSTNFIYKIIGNLSKKDIRDINAIDTRSKVRDRLSAIYERGAALRFREQYNRTFENNLILIDSSLPEILGNLVLDFYSASNRSTLRDLTDALKIQNPLHYDIGQNHIFYEYKIKRFLTDIALGMKPATVWHGEYEVKGGYLIVTETGEIICYHIYDKNEFEDYLMNNTRLETASTSRHDFGEIYEQNGKLYFNLNLQIRFTK